MSPAVAPCKSGASLEVFCFCFFPGGLDLWLGSNGTDSQPGITLVKYFSWNIKIDLISWLILLNEQALSWALARALVSLHGEVPAGLFLEERSLVFLAAPSFDS